MNRISFLNRGYAFKGLLAVNMYPQFLSFEKKNKKNINFSKTENYNFSQLIFFFTSIGSIP